MKTHVQILKLWPSFAALSRQINVSYAAVAKWHIRNSIPSKYWQQLLDAATNMGIGLTYKDLAEAKTGDVLQAEQTA